MIIKSISYDQHEIIQNIITLHTGEIECDVTWGNGNFYRKIKPPKLRLDRYPKQSGVIKADVRCLPLPDNSIRTVMLDPPFMARTGPGATLKARFGELKGTMFDLWDFYGEALTEIYRVLKPEGWLVFKCQDSVLAGTNRFTHVEIFNRAKALGLEAVDLFILLAKHRMMHPKHKTQRHCRKYHSYFWVFQKVTPEIIRKKKYR